MSFIYSTLTYSFSLNAELNKKESGTVDQSMDG
jgi:hypothetical protein